MNQQAVEAAARHMWNGAGNRGEDTWDQAAPGETDAYLSTAREALEGAERFFLAQFREDVDKALGAEEAECIGVRDDDRYHANERREARAALSSLKAVRRSIATYRGEKP